MLVINFILLFSLAVCILTCLMGWSIPAVDDVKPVTHLLAVDVTSKKGIKLLREGISYLVILYAMTFALVFVWISSSLWCYCYHHYHYWYSNNACTIYQTGGSKSARVGVLFSASQDADSSSILLVKTFEITAASYRFPKSKCFYRLLFH